MAFIDLFESSTRHDLFRLCIGEKIGQGVGREVYEWLPDASLVAKVELDGKSFQNTMEWELWNNVAYKKDVGRWFAPCVDISLSGIILLQKKTTPAQRYPDKLPSFLTDTKKNNYGMLGNKFVCHDYGFHRFWEYGMTKRQRKVTWYG